MTRLESRLFCVILLCLGIGLAMQTNLLQSSDEMNQDLPALEKELNAIPGYAAQFRAVFGSGVTADNIAKALAAFERTLVSRNSPFDRYLAGDNGALS